MDLSRQLALLSFKSIYVDDIKIYKVISEYERFEEKKLWKNWENCKIKVLFLKTFKTL